jgi:serine/threonine protein kinase
MATVAFVQHPNVVRFFGVCAHACTRRSHVLSHGTYGREVSRSYGQQYEHAPGCSKREPENGSHRCYRRYSAEKLRDRLVTLESKARMLRDVAAGLSRLHSQKIVHRDIALRNVLLRADGTALVSDLGLAQALRAAAGTPDTTEAKMPARCSAPVSRIRRKLRGRNYST